MDKKRSNSALKPIAIPQLLQISERGVKLPVQDYLQDLETLTPVQGTVEVEHKGRYLEVRAEAKAIVTLTCDRCLSQYNHRVQLNAQEVIWLRDETIQSEIELDSEESDLVETLPPNGTFDPAQWLYEQVCLAIPPQKLCDDACEGIEIDDAKAGNPLDGRWSILEQLKNQMKEA